MAVKRLLCYIKGTLDQVIVFPKSGRLQLMVFSEAPTKSGEGEPGLIAFSDADRAGDIDEGQSTSGVLIFLGSAPITLQSLKQKMVALSTCEAKYVASATAACQVVWLRRLLGELTGKKVCPPMLMVDKSAIALTKTLSSMTEASTSNSTSLGIASTEDRLSSSSSRPACSSLTSSPSPLGASGSWS